MTSYCIRSTTSRKSQEDKLRSIPIRLLFNEPELNFRADYTLFDRQSGRPICVGNGEICKRLGSQAQRPAIPFQ